jgi:hypothetical protein
MIKKLGEYYLQSLRKVAGSVLRESGLALYLRGSDQAKDCAWVEPLSRHRVIN